jgi:DNA-binding NarL/FixJ family response regulator
LSIRVLLADDQPLMRTGLQMILRAEPDIEVVGEAGNGRDAVDIIRRLAPDVVLMDIRMPELDGLEATRQLLSGPPLATRIIILTTFEDDQYVFDAIRAGASGFLLKTTAADQLVDAIRLVAAGDALLAPSVTRKLIEEFVLRSPAQTTTLAEGTLTDRELEVLKLVARGLSNAEIADKLFLSEATVKTHVGRVLSKLELRDRAQVVVYAYEAGIVRPGSA